MIKKYINDLEGFLIAFSAVIDIDVIRRDIRDTGFEKFALFR